MDYVEEIKKQDEKIARLSNEVTTLVQSVAVWRDRYNKAAFKQENIEIPEKDELVYKDFEPYTPDEFRKAYEFTQETGEEGWDEEDGLNSCRLANTLFQLKSFRWELSDE